MDMKRNNQKNYKKYFKLKKENVAIKDRIIRDIRILNEQEEGKYYYKPIRVGNYTEHENSGDRNKKYDNGNKVTNELFESLLARYQIRLDTSMKMSNFIFDFNFDFPFKLLYYKCNKINLKRGRSYINSPDWKKRKKQQ